MNDEDEMSDAFPEPVEETEEVETEETETEGGDEERETVDEAEEKNPTALIPTSALGKNAKAGDTITLTVVKVHDDEVEVRLSSGKKIKEPEAKSADSELDEMAATY